MPSLLLCTWLLLLNGPSAPPGHVAVLDPISDTPGGAHTIATRSTAIQHLELAGNSLPSYPFFEFVRAFHYDATVELAVDPSRHPQLVGVTADIYIIGASSGPTLFPRAPVVTFTFVAGSIRANTVLIAHAGVLDPSHGLELGAPYDVVLDVNRNGVLDDGDYVDDGLTGEAGLYVLPDLTAPGPLAVSSVDITLDLPQKGPKPARLSYPADIAQRGRLPLVLIGHGSGHHYTWYDYLQSHFASHGYISLSHDNDTDAYFGGIPRVLRNTDALLEQQGVVAGGVLKDHIDEHRIVFIGHSTGGMEVVLGLDQLATGAYQPLFFEPQAVRLASAIASPALEESDGSTAHDYPFHLLYGSSDGDIGGWPECETCQAFRHLDRGTGARHSTYVHGADHNDFNCCGFEDFLGPPETKIGREEAQRVAKAVYLVLLKHYLDHQLPATELLWRQWERFHPGAVAPTTIVVQTSRNAADSHKFVIDDFQSEPSPSVSSSGGQVTFSVTNLVEDRMADKDFTFTWVPSDPMNGMTGGGPHDSTRGVVFDWDAVDADLEFELVPAARNVLPYRYLSFRACQGTRHPLTVAELADLVFTVTLRDGAGTTSTIDIAAYGGGIEEPYQRTGSGNGVGWQNEFETIRIRLADFLVDGTHLDLRDIVAVRFDFGPHFGSARGRLALDDVELVDD